MKKILFVIDNAFHYAGTENICNFMSEAFGENNIIDILSMSGEGETFYPYSHVRKVVSLDNKRNKLFSAAAYVYQNTYDVYFVISMGKLSFLFRWLSLFLRKKNKKIYACEHVSIQSFPSWVRILKTHALKWYDKTIVLTEHDYKYLRTKSVDAVRIPNPIFYHGIDRTVRTQRALAVGRLENQKGFSDLIDIWSLFVKYNKEWKLLIVGDGSLKSELSAKVSLMKMDDSIQFLGRKENVSKYYQECDVLLMTSHYEGLPLVLLEAKSWSMPAIAFDCPTGPKEIIEDGVDGYLVNKRDSIEFCKKLTRIADDDELFFQMSSATKVTHQKFDAKKIKRQWEALIN